MIDHNTVKATSNQVHNGLKERTGKTPLTCIKKQHKNTGSERRTPFTTVDNTGGETTVVLDLQQLCSEARSSRGTALIFKTRIYPQKSVWERL